MLLVVCLLVIFHQVLSQNGRDIAYNKPVSQNSTSFDDDPSTYGAEFAVNGLGCQTQGGHRFRTKSTYRPTITIDLQGQYFITTVYITPAPDPSESRQYNIFYNQPLGDPTKCFWYGQGGKTGPSIGCNRIGRIVAISRWDSARLSFCRIQVYGDELCNDPMKYGSNCWSSCASHCNSWCRKRDGWCPGTTNCVQGYYGDRCDIQCIAGCKTCRKDDGQCLECNEGLYGELCNKNCGTGCKLTTCRKADGFCSECKQGYYGFRCDIQCSSNCKTCNKDTGICEICKDRFYGDECMERCSTGCKTPYCSKSDGMCTCKPRHNQIHGTMCEPCPSNCSSCNETFYCDSCLDGYYSYQCKNNCSTFCETASCDRQDGSCQCQVGYADNPCRLCPDNCDASGCIVPTDCDGCGEKLKCQNCKPGYHGLDCSAMCSTNCVNNACQRNGSCECEPGFAGFGCCPKNCPKNCDNNYVCHSCESTRYGETCSDVCSSKCKNSCSKDGGMCDECRDGQWGSDCSKTCSDNCHSKNCSRHNGACPCKPGYMGTQCLEKCENNYWGNQCNQTCHCASGSCHHVNGSCDSGCAPQWTGVACQQYLDQMEPGKPNNLPVIGGAVGAVVVVLLGVGLVLFLVLRRRRSNSTKDEPVGFSNIDAAPSLHTAEDKSSAADLQVSQAPTEKKMENEQLQTCDSNTDVTAIYQNLAIPVSELPVYIQKMKARGDGFQKEFKDLPTGLKFPATVGSKPENIKKNRFKNIIAYDHSLVKLGEEEDTLNSAYINANWIKNFENEMTFIAAQGALKNAEAEFIRLLWEHNVPLVVMVTKLIENNINKCERYWPEDDKSTLKFGDFSVSARFESQTSHYVIRKLSLKKDSECKTLTQIQFKSWPDHGVPKCPSSFLEFHKMAQKMYRPEIGPTLVHCSAGVGRTGTFLAVDYLLRQAAVDNGVSVMGCLDLLRQQRPNMVQSLDQYIFIYETVMEALLCGQTTYPVATFASTWKEIKKSELLKQFETLHKMKRVNKESEFADANSEVNVKKNRNPQVVPTSVNRVRLMTDVPDGNDYINAVFVHGYQRKNEFVVTQWPLDHTEVDFWRLCVDYKCATVVALNNMDDKRLHEYWPNSTPEKTCGPFAISKEKESMDASITTRDLTCTIRQKNIQKLRQFMVKIPSGGLPEISSILAVYEFSKRWHNSHGEEARCIIHCGDGSDITGLFLAFWLVCDKITDEQEVDIFHTVKQIRASRPQFITNLEQYMWLHQAAENYIDSFSSYANFR